MRQDPAPPRVSRGGFQNLPFFRSTQQIYQGEPSHQSPPLPMVSEHKMLADFEMLHANLGVQGATDLLSNVYNLVQTKKFTISKKAIQN